MLCNRYLRIFVEGPSDKDLFEKKLKSVINKHFKASRFCIEFIEYKSLSRFGAEEINRILIMSRKYGDKVIFTGDCAESHCITEAKDKLKKTYTEINNYPIFIVKQEIESWYLAGLDKRAQKELGLEYYSDTDKIKRSRFKKMVPDEESYSVFLNKILPRFKLAVASKQNSSFKYFIDHLCKKRLFT